MLFPLSAPALAASSALGAAGSWNALLLTLVVVDNQELWTLSLGTMQFSGQYLTEGARVVAFVVIVMIPAVVFCLLAERHIVAGLTGAAVKG